MTFSRRIFVAGCLALTLLALPRAAGLLALNTGYIDLLRSRMGAGLTLPPNVSYSVPTGGDAARLFQAQQSLTQAAAVGAVRPPALAGLARVYSDSGDVLPALQAWQMALASGYQPQLANLALANLYAQEDNRPLAVQHWQASVAPNAEAWMYLSRRIFVQGGDTNRGGRWHDAIQVLEDALSRVPMSAAQRAAVHIELSDMHASLGEGDKGLQQAYQAVASDPGSAAAHAWLARYLHRHMGEETQAALAAERALALGPNWWAHLVLGDIRLAGCELDDAIHHYQAGMNLSSGGDWRHIYLLEGLSLAFWERGDSAAALAAMERFAARQPNIQRGQERLAQARTGDLPRRCLEEVK